MPKYFDEYRKMDLYLNKIKLDEYKSYVFYYQMCDYFRRRLQIITLTIFELVKFNYIALQHF